MALAVPSSLILEFGQFVKCSTLHFAAFKLWLPYSCMCAELCHLCSMFVFVNVTLKTLLFGGPFSCFSRTCTHHLENLLHFTGKKTRAFNVAAQVGTAYSKMGVFLLKDETGAVVQALENEHMKDAEKINIDIFSRWLQGKGAQPVAWSTLIGVLRKIGRCVLADDIEGGL